MSIWRIVDELVTLHDRAGKLRDLRDAWQAINRAQGFDVNDEDSWDAYLLGDSMIRDMRNRLRRHRDRTMQLRDLAAIMPGDSGQATRLFLRWADARRDRGAGSREAQAARTALARYLYDWADGLTRAMDDVHDAGQVLRAQLTFYRRFRRLADAFVRVDTLISGTAQDPTRRRHFMKERTG